MEQHPIPQDVTGFQFKLIGSMTVKQFGYVAAGAVMAVVCWYLPVQGFWNLVTKIIFLPFFGLTGVIIAFVPIEGRPIDIMTGNFIHALITPNQYVYIKTGRKFSFTQITLAKVAPDSKSNQKPISSPGAIIESSKQKQLRALLSNSYTNVKNNLDEKELAFLKTVNSAPLPKRPTITANAGHIAPELALHPPIHTQTIPKTATPTSLPTQEMLKQKEALLQQQITIAKQEKNLSKSTSEANASHEKVIELQKQIQDTHMQKQQVEQELLKLKNQLSAQKPAVVPATLQEQRAAPQIPHQDINHVRNIPQSMTKNAGFSHVSDTPNVIIGIVKDSRGNVLPSILVEIKDKDGNPVRAFKTNPLGQFISATPLANGSYTIELEDPKNQHAFDTIQINAVGQIMLPIEIISHDAREELRKALFN